MSIYTYPLDTTGSAATNKVVGERHTLTPPVDSRDYHYIITRSGPFYRDTLKMVHEGTGRELIENLDWTPGHLFNLASYETEYVQGGIYQTIVFLDRSISGTVLLEKYQVLGGEWSLDENKILEILSNKVHDPRQYSYETVSGKPETFPAIKHSHPADDIVGQRELVEATMLIAQAIRDRTSQLPPEIIAIMMNYYDKATLDSMLVDLTVRLIQDIAGPELNRIVMGSIADILTGYVTTAEFNLAVNTINTAIDQLNTKQNTQATSINSINQSLLTLSQAISNIVTEDSLTARLDALSIDFVTKSEFTTYQGDISTQFDSLFTVLSTLSETLTSLMNSMSNYVRKDELETLLPETVLTARQVSPMEVDTVNVGSGLIDGILPIVIEAHTLRSGYISTLTLKTNNDHFLNIHPFVAGGFGISKRVQIVESQHIWDFVNDWQDAGFSSENDALLNRSSGLTPFNPIQYAIYLSIDYTVVIAPDTYRTNLRLEKIPSAGLDPVGTVIEISKRKPHPSDVESLLVGIIGVTTTGQIKLKTMVNRSDITITETKTKILTQAELATNDPVVIEFKDNFGHNCISNLLGVKMFDPNGVLMGVAGYFHDYKPCLYNKVTILKPSIDISSFGPDATIRIEVTVMTSTK